MNEFSSPLLQDAAKSMSAFDFYRTMCSHAPVLQHVGKRILGQRQGASSCERNWKEYKDIRTATKNRMLTDTVEKIVVVKTSLLLEAENSSSWKTELNKFSKEDEFVQFDVNVANAFSTKVLKFNNYAEDWEADCLRNKCTSNENKLVSKYRFISFYDVDVKETRRIVSVQWNVGAR